MAKTILAISGKPGLYELVSRANGTLIVEGLVDHKRIPAFVKDRVTSLADICMYTEEDDKPLGEILCALRDLEGGKKSFRSIWQNSCLTSTENVCILLI